MPVHLGPCTELATDLVTNPTSAATLAVGVVAVAIVGFFAIKAVLRNKRALALCLHVTLALGLIFGFTGGALAVTQGPAAAATCGSWIVDSANLGWGSYVYTHRICYNSQGRAYREYHTFYCSGPFAYYYYSNNPGTSWRGCTALG